MKNSRLTLLPLLFILCLTNRVQAQNADLVTLSARDFEKWSSSFKGRLAGAMKDTPKAIVEKEIAEAQNSVLERLQADKWTTDDAIINIVIASTRSETPPLEQTNAAPQALSFPKTLAFIDQLVTLLADRRELQAYLFAERGYLCRMSGRSAEAISAFQKSLDIGNALTSLSQLRRHARTVELADLLLSAGDKTNAEKLFLEVLSFPWYTVRDEEAMQNLKQLYVSAGEGVIETRRGNLQKLKSLYFVPATQTQLQPLLDEAINEAQAATPQK